MNYKAHYSLETGKIQGLYPEDIEYAEIPVPYIVITEKQHEAYLANQQGFIVNDGQMVPHTYEPTLVELKAKEQAEHTSNHIAYQNKPFQLIVKREDITKNDLHLIFNCTDDVRKNFESSQKVAEACGEVYFYDGFGLGDYLSLAEMRNLSKQFMDRLNPSFIIKGKGKFSINGFESREIIIGKADIYKAYFDELYSLLNAGKNEQEIKEYINALVF